MTQVKDRLKKAITVLVKDSVVISVEKDGLLVQAGNKSAEDVKTIAVNFFKSAYKLTKK